MENILDATKLQETKEHIAEEIKQNSVILYMKGEKTTPMCGFSALAIEILNFHSVEYKTYNVLADPYLRQAIKDFSDWPTTPQLYVKGEFIGGSDIMKKLHDDKKFAELFQDS